jgi:hypothetical protein
LLADEASPGLGKGLVKVEEKEEVVVGLLDDDDEVDFLVLPNVNVLEVNDGVMGLLGIDPDLELDEDSLRNVLRSLRVLVLFLVGLLGLSPLVGLGWTKLDIIEFGLEEEPLFLDLKELENDMEAELVDDDDVDVLEGDFDMVFKVTEVAGGMPLGFFSWSL